MMTEDDMQLFAEFKRQKRDLHYEVHGDRGSEIESTLSNLNLNGNIKV